MNISVEFDKAKGRIKPIHSVGNGPVTSRFTVDKTEEFRNARIPYSRLHDTEGTLGSGEFVNIHCIFKNFDADVNDPASYSFECTDIYLKNILAAGTKVFYRLGETIENKCMVVRNHTYVPKDFQKWAEICEHIIRHYNEGWADGYHMNIEYWEIWNEPENRENPSVNQMWTGTAEQYYELYDVTAKHLKKCFGDKIKVGGYGACGFYGIFGNPEKYGVNVPKRDEPRYNSPKEEYRMNFLFGFFDYIKSHGTPIDFFSWHTYGTVDVVSVEADFVEVFLDKYGYGHIETHLGEWNLSHDRFLNKGTSYASAHTMAMMLELQHKKTDMLMYYDARFANVNAYAGFFDPVTFETTCVYYSFKAFGELYTLGSEAKCECEGVCDGVYAVSATDGERKSLIVSNVGKETFTETNLTGDFTVYIIDKDNYIEKTDLNPCGFTLNENTVAVIKNF